jgi:SAM-dependent methyltransferase
VSASRQRHARLAGALPGAPARIADLGSGEGRTLLALRERFGPQAQLIGVERHPTELLPGLEAEVLVADLNKPLPFDDASLDAALCHNVIEALVSPDALLAEIARVLVPGGHFLLSNSDFDTLVFNTPDLGLTRELIHTFADTQEPWMDRADGTIGRKLLAIARRAPLELVDTLAWVELCTDVSAGSAAEVAIGGISGAVRRDRPDLAARLEEWVADVHALAGRGELICSINDYAVLLRRPAVDGV